MKADTITKAYVQDAGIFADIFNYYVYKGRQVIKPEQLTERDSTKIALPYGADDAVVPVQKFRDVQKLYAAMTDGKIEYVLYGVENQTEIHYAMPVKNYLYDALDYAGQVEEAARSHRKKRKAGKETGESSGTPGKENLSTGEFLSGFWREDRLLPSITVTIFFGSEPWDGPLSLSDMIGVSDPSVLACMNDYHVHLIAPAQMTEEEIMMFQSSLREVLLFIKYSKDKEALSRVMERDKKRFSEMERRAVDVIRVITNSGIEYEEDEEVIDMCQALQEMQMEAEQRGKQIGRQEGVQEGMHAGRQEGMQKGELKKAKETVKNLYELGVEIETIAKGVGYPVETIKEWLGLDKQSVK